MKYQAMTEPKSKLSKRSPIPVTHNPSTTVIHARTPRFRAGGLLSAIILCLIVYLLRLDRTIGMMIDDAWYVLLAQSIASGQGYTVVNSPTSSILPLYPPGFPALLSLVFRIAPEFPGNIFLLKAVSIAAMGGLGLWSYRYFHRQRELPWQVAAGIAIGVVVSPPLVTLATSTVMSECVFAFSFLGTVALIETSAKTAGRGRAVLWALLAAGFASFTFLTRSMAIGLLLAGVLYLFWQKRKLAATAFAVTSAFFSLPWLIYSRLHRPTREQQIEQGGHIIRGYGEQFWDRVAGYPELGQISLSDLPIRVWNNLLEISGLNVGAILTNPLFPGLNQGTGERWGGLGTIVSLMLSAVVIMGFISVVRRQITFAEIALPLTMAAPLTWGFAQFRYTAPFTPFLLFYFAMGLSDLYRRTANRFPVESLSTKAMGAGLGLCVMCSLLSHGMYLSSRYSANATERPGLLRSFEQHEKLLQWANENLPSDAVLVTQNPPLTFLYTHRKTINSDHVTARWERWKNLGVRYFVRTSPSPLPEKEPLENLFHIVHRVDGDLRLRVTDLGAPQTRAALTPGLTERIAVE